MTLWAAYDPFCPPPYLQSPNSRRRPLWQSTRALIERARLPTKTLWERHHLLRLLQFKITQKRCRLGRERQNASLHCWSQLALVNWKSLSEKKRLESKEGEVARCDRALREKVLQLETELAKIVLSAYTPLSQNIASGSEKSLSMPTPAHAHSCVCFSIRKKLEHAKNTHGRR